MTGSFSLVEKLAVAGAFCALVALAVGTETDPGILVTTPAETQQAVASARAAEPAKASSSYWSLSGDTPQGAQLTHPAPPAPPEDLPTGFGSTPSPDLPM